MFVCISPRLCRSLSSALYPRIGYRECPPGRADTDALLLVHRTYILVALFGGTERSGFLADIPLTFTELLPFFIRAPTASGSFHVCNYPGDEGV